MARPLCVGSGAVGADIICLLRERTPSGHKRYAPLLLKFVCSATLVNI